MLQQLLWLEILLKASVGLSLLLAPRTLAKMLGLPSADEPFWPRLLGGTLIGLATAILVELRLQPGRSLGLTGIVAINLCVAVVLGGLVILGKAGSTRRGRASVGLAAVVLTLIALVAIVSAL